MPEPEKTFDREYKKQRAQAILRKVGQHALKNLPIIGGVFDLGFEIWEACKESELNPAQEAEALMLLSQKEAEEAVAQALGSPDAQAVTMKLPPQVLEELHQRLVHIPGDLRMLPEPPKNDADLARVILGDKPRRFSPGDRTPDRQYTLETFLGFGGFGEVWGAKSFRGERRAVKFCLDPSAREDLETEYEAMLALYDRLSDQTGVVDFYPSNIHCDPPYLVMELCEGGDLLDWIDPKSPPLPPDRCVAAMAAPLMALARAHEAGIVHRDIKPANILAGGDRVARLADFGLARIVVERNMDEIVRAERDGRSSKAMGVGIAGTALYMAPEVKHGRVRPSNIDGLRRADVYSFGVTLAQLLSGDATLESGKLGKSCRQRLPEAIARLVAECVEHDPAERFANAGEILAFMRSNRLWTEGDDMRLPPRPGQTVSEAENEEVRRREPATAEERRAAADGHGNRAAPSSRKEYAQRPSAPGSEELRAQADAGNPEALRQLGWLHESGEGGTKKDYEAAVGYYQRAANGGSVGAMKNLGWMYQSGRGVEQDLHQALAWYQKAAEAGHAGAMKSLAWLYENGRGVKRDLAKAADWNHRAARQGNVAAMFSFASMLEAGAGVAANFAEAEKWYREAASKGHPDAKRKVELIQRDKAAGKAPLTPPRPPATLRKEAPATPPRPQAPAPPRRETLARKEPPAPPRKDGAASMGPSEADLLHKAELGDAEALYELGWRSEKGQNAPLDVVRAIQWYEKAADRGHAIAMNNIGRIYSKGEGVPRDEAKAVGWFRKAAELGYAASMHNLGARYEKGEGVEKDIKQALEWLRKASDLGFNHSTRRLKQLEERREEREEEA
jgi:TPR repeat protein